MKTIIIAFFISILFILNTKAQINYHVYGTMDRTDVDKVYLSTNKEYIDSANVKAGKFEMKGKYKTQAIAFILIKTPPSFSKIILDNGEYTILLDTKLSPINIKSTSINHNLWQEFLNGNERKANQKSQDSLLNDYKLQIEKGNYNMSAKYLAKYHGIQLQMLNCFKKLVTDHPDCYIIPYLLKGEEILTQENFGSTFNLLSPEVRNNEWGQQLKTSLETKKTPKPDQNLLAYTVLGNNANYFDTKQVDGKIFNFASLKGKWVLLDFWASWCAPCRAELPELKKAYEQFKDKNFIISYVSVDKTTTAWQKALLEDKTPPFIHTNIAEFGNSEGFKYYQVNSIPANFLINPEGRIVAMDLRGDKLFKTLTRLIK
jgi:thiol-disulfide isomerase/thioredoxin